MGIALLKPSELQRVTTWHTPLTVRRVFRLYFHHINDIYTVNRCVLVYWIEKLTNNAITIWHMTASTGWAKKVTTFLTFKFLRLYIPTYVITLAKICLFTSGCH